jgi:hypothetical protein
MVVLKCLECVLLIISTLTVQSLALPVYAPRKTQGCFAAALERNYSVVTTHVKYLLWEF